MALVLRNQGAAIKRWTVLLSLACRGVQMLFRPLPCNGKGVTDMTTSELYEFCLVLISLAELIVLIIQLNKKK